MIGCNQQGAPKTHLFCRGNHVKVNEGLVSSLAQELPLHLTLNTQIPKKLITKMSVKWMLLLYLNTLGKPM